jgi:hypothetical protein
MLNQVQHDHTFSGPIVTLNLFQGHMAKLYNFFGALATKSFR